MSNNSIGLVEEKKNKKSIPLLQKIQFYWNKLHF